MKLSSKTLFDRNFILEHPNFINTYNTLMSSVMNLHLTQIPLVVGPSAVGKTTLIRKVIVDLNEFIEQNPELGFGPPIVVEARAPEGSEFSWKTFYLEILDKLGEPLIGKKIAIAVEIERLRERSVKSGYKRITIDELRILVQECINVRRPIAIIIDECQSIANKNISCHTISNNLDVVKSLSNKRQGNVKPRIILLGTYATYNLLVNNGQLARRIRIIDFKRYKINEDSIEVITRILSSLIEAGYPISKSVLKKSKYCANHTLGCVGILLEWLSAAYQYSWVKNLNLIDYECLKHTQFDCVQLTALALEIKLYEARHHYQDNFNELDIFNMDAQNSSRKNSSSKPTPGIRLPKRDKVGGDDCHA